MAWAARGFDGTQHRHSSSEGLLGSQRRRAARRRGRARVARRLLRDRIDQRRRLRAAQQQRLVEAGATNPRGQLRGERGGAPVRRGRTVPAARPCCCWRSQVLAAGLDAGR